MMPSDASMITTTCAKVIHPVRRRTLPGYGAAPYCPGYAGCGIRLGYAPGYCGGAGGYPSGGPSGGGGGAPPGGCGGIAATPPAY